MPAREVNALPCRERETDILCYQQRMFHDLSDRKLPLIHAAELTTAERYVFAFEQFLGWTKKWSSELLVRSAFKLDKGIIIMIIMIMIMIMILAC
jgi:hypothetical protein